MSNTASDTSSPTMARDTPDQVVRAGTQAAYDALVLRLRNLTVARVAAILLTVVVLAPSATDDSLADTRDLLALASALYLAAQFAALLLVRWQQRLVRPVLELTLVVDALWAGVVLWATGGVFSSLVFLLYLQLVAVTVLFTWRTGLRLAILDTIAIVTVVLLTGTGTTTTLDTFVGMIPVRISADGATGPAAFERTQVFFVLLTLWVLGAATAFFTSLTERDLRRSNQELAVLRELASDLESSLELNHATAALARGVVDELGYDRAIVWMAGDGADLSVVATAGFRPDDGEPLGSLTLSAGATPIAQAVETRAPQLIARDHARPAALADGFDIDSPLILVPLMAENRLLGLLTVEVPQPFGRAPRVRGRNLRILATVATEAALAIDNARLHAELQALSVTDALTGVYNHRFFQQRFQEELDRAVRTGTDDAPTPVSLVIMDLDFFKQVNDRFGHLAGDELLRTLARLADHVLRSTDIICRYGGEEFAIILPDTPSGAAMQVAERLREAIERSNFIAADGRYLGKVTASFGVATFTGGLPARKDLIEAADAALYAAKSRGRNQVVHAHDAAVGEGLHAG